jgi:YhcN/YlaJ family sporulation lipoprotein
LSDGNGDLTKDVEGKISDQDKAVDQDIDNVYVSVNPDFYDRMTGYTEDIRAGQPIEGFFDEFTETVRRIFPAQR